MAIILGLRPKPRRYALAILKALPHALRYRLMAIILGRCGYYTGLCPNPPLRPCYRASPPGSASAIA